MSATAFKVVDAGLTSPFLPWTDNFFSGDPRITYVVGESFDAAGIQAILGYRYRATPTSPWVEVPPPDPPIDITDPVNTFRGILAFPSLDTAARAADLVPEARYLELSYDPADVLGSAGDTPPAAVPYGPGSLLWGDALSLAHVTVVAEVTP